jgi:hypothetical protein
MKLARDPNISERVPFWSNCILVALCKLLGRLAFAFLDPVWERADRRADI